MIDSERFARVLAWLLRNEAVDASSISRAVTSAIDMKIGESVTLAGDDAELYRRAFVNEQIRLFEVRK